MILTGHRTPADLLPKIDRLFELSADKITDIVGAKIDGSFLAVYHSLPGYGRAAN